MNKKNMNQIETGRSMVEMLGVLAVMALLSIVGILGLRSTLDSAKANKIIQALSRRATVLAADKTFGTGFTDNASFGQDTDYTITCSDVPDVPFFTCTVQNVEQKVCQKILDLNWELPYYLSPKECITTNTLTAYFKADLGGGTVSACPAGLAYFKGGCIPSDTPIDNGCTAEKPVRRGGVCYPCTTNIAEAIYKVGTTGQETNYNSMCEEYCPNRTYHAGIKCGGASPNQLGVCSLSEAPADKPLLGCTGVWRSCPASAKNYEQLANQTDCYDLCEHTFIATYCYSCDFPSSLYVKETWHKRRPCPNRIWDTTQCKNHKGGSWTTCGENGTYQECSGRSDQIECISRLKTAAELAEETA